MAEYLVVKALLHKCYISVDIKAIEELRERGYKIYRHSADAYEDSLLKAYRRVGNINTKITMIRNELTGLSGEASQQSFGQVMANLRFALRPTTISDTLLLSEYNEYVKMAKTLQRNGRNKQE